MPVLEPHFSRSGSSAQAFAWAGPHTVGDAALTVSLERRWISNTPTTIHKSGAPGWHVALKRLRLTLSRPTHINEIGSLCFTSTYKRLYGQVDQLRYGPKEYTAVSVKLPDGDIITSKTASRAFEGDGSFEFLTQCLAESTGLKPGSGSASM
jgi:hypothetical protein